VDATTEPPPAAPAGRGRRWADPLLWWAAVATAYAVWLAVALLLDAGSLVVDLALAGLLSGVTALVCRRAASAPALPAPVCRFWRRSSLTLLLSMLGLLVEAGYGLHAGQVSLRQTPLPSNLLSLAAIGVATWTMLLVPVPRRARGEWLRLALDAGTVVLSVTLFGWYLVVGPRLADRGVDHSSLLMALALLVAMGLCGLIAVKVALAGQMLFDRSVQRLLGLLVVSTVPLAVVRVLPLGSGLQHSGLAAIIAVDLLLALAAERQRRVPHAAPVRRPRRQRHHSLLPYLSVAATLGLLLHFAMPRLDAGGQLVLCGTVGLIVLVVARQLTALRDNARLLARLDASLTELRHQEQRFRSLVQHSADVIMVTDGDGAITYVSPAIAQVLGHPPERWQGRRPVDLVHPDDLAEVQQRRATLLRSPGASIVYQVRVAHADGGWRWLEVVGTNMLHDPSVAGIVVNARDVTTSREFQDRLRHQASHDHLTGLANRSLFDQRLRRALAQERPASVLLVDLDGFKQINDRFGHAVGDQVLVAVAKRLLGCVRPPDLVARLGGDEFGVLLDGAEPGRGDAVATRLLGAFADPISVEGHRLALAASVGVAAGHYAAGDDPDRLLRRADAAMYAAKRGDPDQALAASAPHSPAPSPPTSPGE
jgi:diguanylate cyclase (GGDEF)-like protein/PAS domain S-box-containing protein